MKQFFGKAIIFFALIVAILGLSSCSLIFSQEIERYNLSVNYFDREVVYGQEVDISGLGIEVTTGSSIKTIRVTRDMVTGDDTSSVGVKTLYIEYKGELWTLVYEVLYKVEYYSDGKLYDSQLVSSAAELMDVQTPEKDGATFLGWSQKIPSELTGNLRIEAIFTDTIKAPTFEATYGDTIGDLELPKSSIGTWSWGEEITKDTPVGSVGTNSFEAIFTPKNEDLDPITFTAKVKVSKKSVEIRVIEDAFEYDGSYHGISYALYSDGEVLSDEDVFDNVICFGTTSAKEIGEYSYTLRLYDDNYQADTYKGTLQITKIALTVEVLVEGTDSSSKEITYGDNIDFIYRVLDKNGNEIVLLIADKNGNAIKDKNGNYVTAKNASIVTLIVDSNGGLITDNSGNIITTENGSIATAILGKNGKLLADKDGNAFTNIVFCYAIIDANDNALTDKDGKVVTVTVDQDGKAIADQNNLVVRYTDESNNTVIVSYDENGNLIMTYDTTVDGETTTVTKRVSVTTVAVDKDKKLVIDENGNMLHDANTVNVVVDTNGNVITDANGDAIVGVTTLKSAILDESGNVITDENGNVISDATLGSAVVIKEGKIIRTLPSQFSDLIISIEKPNSFTAGEHAITASVDVAEGSYSLDYFNITLENATVTVKQKSYEDAYGVPEYEIATKNIYYGDLLSSVEFAYNPNGTWSWTDDYGNTLDKDTTVGDAGKNTFIAVFTPKDTSYSEYTIGIEITVLTVSNEWTTEPSIVGWTYGETTNSPIAKARFGEVKYEYSSDGNNWAEWTDESYPTNAGTYQLRASIEGTNNYFKLASTVSFKIEKAEASIVAKDTVTSRVYTGSAYDLSVITAEVTLVHGDFIADNLARSIMFKKDKNSEETTVTEIKNAGTYTVTYTYSDGNHNEASATVIVTVEKASAVITVIDNTETSRVYTGSKFALANLVKASAYDGASILSAITKDGTSVEEIKDAGEYRITFSLAESDNYNAATDVTVTIIITQKPINKPAPSDRTFIYTGSKQTYSLTGSDYYTISDNNKQTNAGKYEIVVSLKDKANYSWSDGSVDDLTYDFTIAKATATITVTNTSASRVYTGSEFTLEKLIEVGLNHSESTLETTITKGGKNSIIKDAGEYKVTFSLAESDNYKAVIEEVTITIAQAQNSWTKVLSITDWTYGEYDKDTNSPTAEAKFGNVEYEYLVNGDWTKTVPTNAGTYTVRATVAESENWSALKGDDAKTASLTIAQKAVAVPTVSGTYIYKGSEHTLALNNYSESIMSVSGDTKATNASTYTATITLDSNYKWESTFNGNISWTIEKKNISGATINLGTSLTYNGSEQTQTVTSVKIGDNWTLTSGTDYTVSDNTGTDAGTNYELTIKGIGNFTGTATAKFTIAKCKITAPTLKEYNKEFTASILRPEFSSETNSLYSITNNGGYSVGSYPVTLTLNNSNNYEWEIIDNQKQTLSENGKTVTMTFEITKSSVKISGLAITGWTYGDKPNSPSASKDKSFGTIVYTYKKWNGAEWKDVSALTSTSDAGKYRVIAMVEATNDYYGDTKEVEFTISPKDISGATINLGDKLTYDGSKQTQTVTSVIIDGLTVTYDVSDNTGTEAKTYTLTVTGTGNFTGSKKANFTIEKANATITAENTNASRVYTGSAFTLSDLVTASAYNGANITHTITKNNTTVTEIKDAGEYEVTFSLDESTNYAAAQNVTVTITIAKANATITAENTNASRVYTGSAFTLSDLVTASAYNGANITHTITKNNTTVTEIKDAGEYEVTFSLDESTNYAAAQNVTVTITIAKANATITAKDTNASRVYTGSEFTLETLVSVSHSNTDSNATLTWTITKNNESAIIKDAGEYEVTFSLAESDNYNAATDVTVTITIAKANATITAENTNASRVYTGSAFTLSDLVTASAYNGANITHTITKNNTTVTEIKDAGEYKVIFSLDGSDNYNAATDETVTITIAKANATITAENTNASRVYTGSAFTLSDLVTASAYNGANITHTITKNNTTVTEIKDAGEYEVTFSLAESNNYNAATDVSVTITIAKANATITAKDTNASRVYTGSAFTLSDLVTASAYNGANITHTITKNNTTVTEIKDAGEYEVTFSLDESTNYAAAQNVTVTITIAKANATITAKDTNASRVYTGSEFTLETLVSVSHSNTDSNATLTWTITKNNESAIIKDAGEYEVTFSLAESDNYNAATDVTVTITIAKANATITAENTNASRVYTGSAFTLSDLVTASAYNGANITHTITKNNTTVTEIKDAGEYEVTFSLDESTNYAAAQNVTVTITIAKANATITAENTNASRVYTGSAFTLSDLVTASAYNGANITHTITKNNTTVTEIKDAGEYEVTFSLAESNNYNAATDVSVTITIAKANATITAKDTNASRVYTGSEFTLETLVSVSHSNTDSNATLTWTITKNNESATIKDAGEYEVTFSLAESTNYSVAENVTVKITIAKAKVTVPTVSGTYTYNENTTHKLVLSNYDDSIMSIHGTTEANAAGSYNVKVTLKDTNNYEWKTTFDGEISWSITSVGNEWTAELTANYSEGKESWTYGDTISYTATAEHGEVIIEYYVDNKWTKNAPSNAGKYYVRAYVTGNNDYASLNTGSIEFTILPKEIYVPSINGDQTFIYTGSDITPNLNTPTLVNNDTASGVYTIDNLTNSIAGEYTVTVTLKSSNYKWNDNKEGTERTFTYTISPKSITITVTEKITGSTTVTYNGSAYTLSNCITVTIDGAVNSETPSWKIVKKDGSTVTDVTSLKNVSDSGTYYVVLNNESNYTTESTGEFTFTINKAKIDMSNVAWDYTEAFTYEAEKTHTVEVTNLPIGVTVASYTNNSAKNAGTYTASVTFSVKSDYSANYEIDSTTIQISNLSWTINKATVEAPTIAWSEKVYNGTIQKPGTSTNSHYTVTYSNKNSTNVGAYTVTFKLNDFANYKWSDGREDKTITVSYTITKATNVINGTLTINDWTYGDTASTPTGITGAKFGEVKYEYSSDGNNWTEWTATSYPTYAGEYKVRAYVAADGNDNYDRVETDSVTFIINKATVEAPTIAWTEKVYNGNAQKPDASTDSRYEVTYSNENSKNVGTYYVTFKLNDFANYKWASGDETDSRTLSYEITKATNAIYGSLTINDWTYGDTASTPTGISGAKFGEVKYEYLVNSTWTETVPTNAGEYKVRAYVVADGNNYDRVETDSVTFTVAKAEETASVIAKENAKYDKYENNQLDLTYSASEHEIGDYLTPKLSQASSNANLSERTPTVTIAKVDTSAIALFSTTSVEETIKLLNAGTYKVTYTYKETDNYAEVKIEITVVIAKAKIDMSNVAWDYTEAFTYEAEKTHTVEVTNLPANVTATYDGTYSAKNAGTYTASVTFDYDSDNYELINLPEGIETCSWTINKATVDVPTVSGGTYNGKDVFGTFTESNLYTYERTATVNAGEHYVTFKLNDSDNYKWNTTDKATITVHYTISQAKNTWEGNLSINGWTYGEEANSPTGIVNIKFGEITYSYEKQNGNTWTSVSKEEVKNAGNYRVTATIAETTNYTGLSTTATFTIAKATPVITFNTDAKSWTVGSGTRDSYTATATFGTVEIEYYLSSGTDKNGNKTYYSDAYAGNPFYSAGSYKVVATVAEGENWTSAIAEIEFTVTNESVTIKVGNNVSTKTDESGNSYYYVSSEYTGNAQSLAGLIGAYVDGHNNLTDNLIYYINQESATSVTDAGTYTVTIELNNNEYSADTVTVIVEITKVQNSWTENLTIDGWTYGETANSPIAKAAYGTVKYEYSSDGNNWTEWTATSYPTNAGAYTVRATVAESTNYEGRSTTATFTIAKAEVSVPIVSGTYTYTGSEHTLKLEGFDSSYMTINGNTGTNAGDYTATITLDSNYKWESTFNGSISWTIAKMKVDKPSADNTTFTYTGEEQTYGLIGSDYYTISNNTRTAAGSQPVTVSLNDTTNYVWSDNTTGNLTFTFTIAKAKIDMKDVAWDYNGAFTYEAGTTRTVEVTNLPAGVTATYGGTYSATNAGIYTASVTFSVKSDYSANYEIDSTTINISDLSWTINKLQVTQPTADTTVYTYTGNSQTYKLATSDYYEIKGNVQTNAGTHTVTVSLKNTEGAVNYVWKDGSTDNLTFTFTIAKATATISASNITRTYDGKIYTPTATVTLADGKTTTTTGFCNSEILNVGKYTVTYTYSDSNHNEVTKSITVTVNKANLTLVSGIADSVIFYENQIGYDSTNGKLTGTTSDVNFYVKDVSENAVKKDGKYITPTLSLSNNYLSSSSDKITITLTYTFTPTDTENYNELSSSVTINLKVVAKVVNFVWDTKGGFLTSETITGSTITDKSYWGTIEKAVSNVSSGNTVWVLPDTTGLVEIKNDITINSGYTLMLPVESSSTLSNGRNISGEATIEGYGNINKLCQTYVKLAAGTTITVYGTLEIAGELAGGFGGNNAFAGAVGGKYAKLELGKDSGIICSGGTVNSYGFITEAAKDNGSYIKVTEAGTLYQPFVVIDYRGGQATLSAGNSQDTYHICAFEEYIFMNVEPQITFTNGGIMKALANLYTGALVVNGTQVLSPQQNYTEISIIGYTDSYLLQLAGTSENNYITAKYDRETMIIDLDMYGGATLNPMSLKVTVLGVSRTVSTESVFFSIPWMYDISLNDGDYKTDLRIQMNSGSKITVESDAKLTVNNEMRVLDGTTGGSWDFIASYGIACPIIKIDGKDTKQSSQAAEFIVNGEFTVKTFGGNIRSSTSGAKVTISSGISSTLYKAKGNNSGGVDLLGYTLIVSENGTTFTAALVGTSNVTPNTNTLYYYVNGAWHTESYEYTIDYQYPNFTGTCTNSNSSTCTVSSSEFTLSTPTTEESEYTFGGWFLDSGFTKQVYSISFNNVKDYINNGTLILYGKWTKETVYKIIINIDGTETNISLTESQLTASDWLANYETTDYAKKNDENTLYSKYFASTWQVNGSGVYSGYVAIAKAIKNSGSTSITLKANWYYKYSITYSLTTYEKDDSSSSLTLTITNADGTTQTLSASTSYKWEWDGINIGCIDNHTTSGTIYIKAGETVSYNATATGYSSGAGKWKTYYNVKIEATNANTVTSSNASKVTLSGSITASGDPLESATSSAGSITISITGKQ